MSADPLRGTPRRRAPTRRVLARYATFQIPDLLLASCVLYASVHWFGLEPRWAWLGLVAWLAKDVVMFPVLRIAYEPDGQRGPETLVGGLGVAEDRLDPEGYVRVGPELWQAELAARGEPVASGDAVRICAVRGLTLVVEPLEAGGEPDRSGA